MLVLSGVSPLVLSSATTHFHTQGINSTIFCYGATGSGKTFTMRQLISRAVADVFETTGNLPQREYTLRASALEIYNERVRDLASEGTENQDLDVLDVRNKHATMVRDLSVVTITSQPHLERLVEAACARRTVSTTYSPAV